MPIRVFHLDDHELLRIGMQTIIEHCPGLELVGQAATAEEALARIGSTRPDVLILDIELGSAPNGIEVCREIRSRWPEIHCLMLTAYGDDESLFSSIMAGASGFLLKGVKADVLLRSVQAVALALNFIASRFCCSYAVRIEASRDSAESISARAASRLCVYAARSALWRDCRVLSILFLSAIISGCSGR